MSMIVAVVLTLLPWHGASPKTVAPEAAKYNLAVRGAPSQTVQLSARVSSKDWIVAFCTPRLCSPWRYDLLLNRRGSGSILVEVIRDDPSAVSSTDVWVSATGASPQHLRVRLRR
jgi:hypothetical protein